MGRLKLRRIRGQSAFKSGLNSRPVATSKHLAVHYTGDTSPGVATLGLVVGKRFAPLSVERNRVKRLVREVFEVQTLAGGATFVRLRAPLAGAAFSPTLSLEVRQLWHTARAAIARSHTLPGVSAKQNQP
jgi:ribonuclease P protein component